MILLATTKDAARVHVLRGSGQQGAIVVGLRSMANVLKEGQLQQHNPKHGTTKIQSGTVWRAHGVCWKTAWFVPYEGRAFVAQYRSTFLCLPMANEARPCPCDIGDKFEYGGLGEEVQVEHIKAYVTKPATATDKAVIVVQDIFGWQLPNTRYIADLLANNGYIAICPDFFAGKEPWSPSHDWATFQEWLKDRSPRDVNKEADAALQYLKEKCNAKRIAVVGFCWGGIVTHHMMLQYPELKAGVSVYGIIREGEGRYNLHNPTLFIFGEKDTFIPLEQVAVLQENLAKHCKVDFEIKIYPGQTHGFVHRKREDINPEDKPYIEEGRRDMINWLNKYI